MYGANSSEGGITLQRATLQTYHPEGLGPGTTTFTWSDHSATTFAPWLDDYSDSTIANNISFVSDGNKGYTLSPGGQNTTRFTGNISSTSELPNQLTIDSGIYGIMDTTASCIRLSGNNSGWRWAATRKNFANNNVGIRLRKGTLYLDSPNSVGTANHAYIGLGEYSMSSANFAGLFAADEVNVTGNIVVKANVAGGIGGIGDVAIGLDGAGETTFSGNIMLNGVKGSGATNAVVLTAGSLGVASFSGIIQDNDPTRALFPIVVRGAGSIRLSGANTYEGLTVVRAGTLLAAANAPAGSAGALGATTSAVRLGDTTTQLAPVKVATEARRGPFSQFSGYSFNYETGQIIWNSGSGPTKVDNIDLEDGDRILYTQETNNRGGIYIRTSQDQWDRATDFDEVKASEIAYGAQVTVQEGRDKGGRSYYLGNWAEDFVINDPTAANNTAFVWSMDEANPDVALLTDGSYIIGRDIDVIANNSTGTTTLGSYQSDTTSEFSGTINLNRSLQLTAVADSTATFRGKITGSGGIVKTGAGTVVITNNSNDYTGGTSIRLTSAEVLAGGLLEVTNTLNLSGTNDTLEIIGTDLDEETTYTVATYGSLIGKFDAVICSTHEVLYNSANNAIQLAPRSAGTLIIIR